MTFFRVGHRYIDHKSGKTIDAWFPFANTRTSRGCLAEKVGLIKGEFIEQAIASVDEPPTSTEDAYLRLHLLSERSVLPNSINLEGIFALLPIVAWTSAGPVFPNQVETLRGVLLH